MLKAIYQHPFIRFATYFVPVVFTYILPFYLALFLCILLERNNHLISMLFSVLFGGSDPVVVVAVLLLAVGTFLLLVWTSIRIRHNRRVALLLENASAPRKTPKVSVLVPARNEADNLTQTIPLFLQSTYPDCEFIILDDESTDRTAEIIDAWVLKSNELLRKIDGKALPQDWVGKSWACAQLAEQATGEILLFCDADVHVDSQAIERTVSMMLEQEASALNVIPRQNFSSLSQKLMQPLLTHFFSLRGLFRKLTPSDSSSLNSMFLSNVQWLAITRECYDTLGGHEAFKDSVTENKDICNLVAKEGGMRASSALTRNQLFTQGYANQQEVNDSLARQLYSLTKFKNIKFFGTLSWFFFFALIPLLYLGNALVLFLSIAPKWEALPFLLPLVGLSWMRVELSLFAGHSLREVFLHPFAASWAYLKACSVWNQLASGQQQFLWKDRPLLSQDDETAPTYNAPTHNENDAPSRPRNELQEKVNRDLKLNLMIFLSYSLLHFGARDGVLLGAYIHGAILILWGLGWLFVSGQRMRGLSFIFTGLLLGIIGFTYCLNFVGLKISK